MATHENTQPSSDILTAPTAEESNAFQAVAKRAIANVDALTGRTRLGGEMLSEALSESISTSQFALASALIHSWVYSNPTINYSNGSKVKFTGDAWGIAIGGGVIWLSGWMAPAAQVIGDVNFTLVTSPATTEIWLRKNGSTIGVLIGGGINIQTGTVTGSGNIKAA